MGKNNKKKSEREKCRGGHGSADGGGLDYGDDAPPPPKKAKKGRNHRSDDDARKYASTGGGGGGGGGLGSAPPGSVPGNDGFSSKRGKKKKRGREQQHHRPAPGYNDDDNISKGKGKKGGKKSKSEQSSSLAQLLKRHRGVAADTPPPPIWKWKKDPISGGERRDFLAPATASDDSNPHRDDDDDDDAFDECLKTSFAGFHHDPPESLPSALHRDFDSSFDGMERGGLFLYDTVQPGKKRLTRTSVTRTLVGDPGSTYKYLGLRLFSHPWVDVDDDGDAIVDAGGTNDGSTLRGLGYGGKTASALMTMGRLNSDLTGRSKKMLEEHASPRVSPVGSADFNLTLVNKMEPTGTKRDLKREAAYGMGKISVGWHRDSGLKDFSTIAVYQSLRDSPKGGGDDSAASSSSWGVALRAMDGGAGGPLESIPPILVPLPSGSLYYMLDDFNHNHEHAVIAGSGGVRYSSTHRVAREGRGSWRYVREKIASFSAAAADIDLVRGVVATSSGIDLPLRKRRERLASHVRALQDLMGEVEFEWLRQWHVQGQRHAKLHPYWHRPMDVLRAAFRELEGGSCEVVALLKSLSENNNNGGTPGPKGGEEECCHDVTVDVFDVLIESLTERQRLRLSWRERYRDSVFDGIPADERPFPCPCLDREEEEEELGSRRMPENLDGLVSRLRRWRLAYVVAGEEKSDERSGHAGGATANKKTKRSKKSKSGSLTKKESRQRASNWERLKANLKD